VDGAVPVAALAVHGPFNGFINTLILFEPALFLEPGNDLCGGIGVGRQLPDCARTAVQTASCDLHMTIITHIHSPFQQLSARSFPNVVDF
jgi:hypothetical protein